jgi:hypothetical protein
MTGPIRVQGLAEFNAGLRKLGGDLPKAMRLALNKVSDVVIGFAVPRVPRRTGAAAASLRAASTRSAVRVAGGSSAAPYYPWLDFGGRVGPGGSVRRPFQREGRYLYKAYFDNQDEVVKALRLALVDVARQAGMDVQT